MAPLWTPPGPGHARTGRYGTRVRCLNWLTMTAQHAHYRPLIIRAGVLQHLDVFFSEPRDDRSTEFAVQLIESLLLETDVCSSHVLIEEALRSLASSNLSTAITKATAKLALRAVNKHRGIPNEPVSTDATPYSSVTWVTFPILMAVGIAYFALARPR